MSDLKGGDRVVLIVRCRTGFQLNHGVWERGGSTTVENGLSMIVGLDMLRPILIAALALTAAACASPPRETSYGDDALPSAEVLAFQGADLRYKYRNARIARDGQNCAVYQGVAPNGQVMSHPLVGADGQRLCARR